MKKAIFPIGVILFLFIIGGLFYLATPRIVEITPADGASDIPGSTSIRVRFSRMMDVSSVTTRLEINPLPAGQIVWENNTLIFTPQKPWRSGTLVQVRLGSGAKAIHFPQLSLLRPKQWSFKIGSPKILYLYPSESPASLYVYNPITGAKQNLSQAIGEVLDYSVSPNGAMIVIAVGTENGSAIYTMLGIEGKPSLLRSFENRQVNS
ncbi:MAG: Ig-like domain-containing protein, partial [Candidatus Kryptoniota bacterium]